MAMKMTNLSQHKNSQRWTFSARFEATDRKKGMPGPGTYGSTNTTLDKYSHTPKFSMGASASTSALLQKNPGPGQYTPKKDQHQEPPRWGFGSEARLHELKRQTYPGPGHYETRGKLGPDGLQYSMGGKPEGKDGGTPGPGSYKVAQSWETTQTSQPKWGAGSAVRGELTTSKTPGPGKYEALKTVGGNNVMRGTPKWSMRSRSTPAKADVTPGPPAHCTQFTR
mmetsp:Transcript_6408/g.10878  ORF Transcript_6408/g.10878 Transcript_6408/m.10878 type:complete len:224 (-) Transcript_6408:48-719(-)